MDVNPEWRDSFGMSSNNRPSVPRKTTSAATAQWKATAVEPYRVSAGPTRCRATRTFMANRSWISLSEMARLSRRVGWCNCHKAFLWLVGLRADLSAPLALLWSRARDPGGRHDRRLSQPYPRHPRRHRGGGPDKTRAAPDRTAGRANPCRVPARRARCGQSLLQQLPRPRRSPRRHRGGAPRHGHFRLWHGLGALHLWRVDAAS